MRRVLATFFAFALLASATAAVAAEDRSEGQNRLEDRKPPPSLEQRPINLALEVPPGLADLEVPPGFGQSEQRLTRYQDQEPTGFDALARADFQKNAVLVDKVMMRLLERGVHDWAAGLDVWGAPSFDVTTDEADAFIRGLFPEGTDIMINRVDTVRINPLNGINPPEQDRQKKDDGQYHYGGGIVSLATTSGFAPYQFVGNCTLGFAVKMTVSGGQSGYYMTIPDHCVRGFSGLGYIYDGIPTSPGSTLWFRSFQPTYNSIPGYSSGDVLNVYLGHVKNHAWATGYDERCYKWIDLCLISTSGSSEKYDGYVWQSDPQCWVNPTQACQGWWADDAWNVRKVIGAGVQSDGTQISISTAKHDDDPSSADHDYSTVAGFHIWRSMTFHIDDCDTPWHYYSSDPNQAQDIMSNLTTPWGAPATECGDLDGIPGPDSSYGFRYDTATQSNSPIYIQVKETTDCNCSVFQSGISGSPVYMPVGNDSAKIVGHVIGRLGGSNQGVFVPWNQIETVLESDARFTDASVMAWWMDGGSPSWP